MHACRSCQSGMHVWWDGALVGWGYVALDQHLTYLRPSLRMRRRKHLDAISRHVASTYVPASVGAVPCVRPAAHACMQARTHAGAGRAALREGMASNKRELADCVCPRVCWSRVILCPIS